MGAYQGFGVYESIPFGLVDRCAARRLSGLGARRVAGLDLECWARTGRSLYLARPKCHDPATCQPKGKAPAHVILLG